MITKADSHAIFEINSFFLQKNISLKIHEKNGIRLPEIVHLTNNIQITQDRGFPFILHNSEIKLPIKSSKNSKKRVTVCVSLINIETAASNILAASDQTPRPYSPSVHSTTSPPLATNAEKITFGCIRDGVTYISLPQESRDFLLRNSEICPPSGDHISTPLGTGSALEISSTAVSENKLCDICHVYVTICSCRRQCNVCGLWTELGEKCRCDKQNIIALKARIDKDILDESDVVLEDQQTNGSELIDDKFDMFNLTPPAVTDKVDLAHIASPEEKEMVESLLSNHQKAFSSHRYDVGHFEFFEDELDCKPGSSVIERERQMKPSIRDELKPIITELLDVGIIRKATYQGPFLSNSHGVSKPVNNQHMAGKADLHILKQSGGDTNHSRLTLDLRPLNDNAVSRPRINLPSYEALVPVFKNKH